MLSKMLKTSESAGMRHAERHPVGGVVLTKITLENEYIPFDVLESFSVRMTAVLYHLVLGSSAALVPATKDFASEIVQVQSCNRMCQGPVSPKA
jgi:hypothetical protein